MTSMRERVPALPGRPAGGGAVPRAERPGALAVDANGRIPRGARFFVFGDNVNKSSSYRGKQSSAEARAKHLREKIEKGQ